MRRSGERLRVTAQLIRASDGLHLWSNNYDSSSVDTITVQEDIAEKIAVALNVVLDEQAQIERDTRIKSADGTKTYLVMTAATLGQSEKAEALFEEYRGSPDESKFNTLSMYAWTGDRENAKRKGA